jgi:hypothetical protein
MSYIARSIVTIVVFMMTCAAPAALLVGVDTVHAKQTPEQKCQKGRYDAAAKYDACQQKAMSALYGGGKYDKFRKTVGKCTVKYTATWSKLQKRATGTGAYCDNPRFADYGSSVGDRLTGLTWEKKTDDGTVHDKDNYYTWSAGGFGGKAADGSAYTTFLAALNTGCFEGHCDWRLPTSMELQTILLAPYPCATQTCIDQTVFGPTVAGYYWSATTLAHSPGFAWFVYFGNGVVLDGSKVSGYYVRAVRAGL